MKPSHPTCVCKPCVLGD